MAAPAVFDERRRALRRRASRTPCWAAWLRQRVWDAARSDAFAPGERVLELGCGTGEDAIWLARRGMSVLATDVSSGMLRTAAAKIAAAGVDDRVRVSALDAAQPHLTTKTSFDGAFGNFGVLNCVPNRQRLAHWLGDQMPTRRAGW